MLACFFLYIQYTTITTIATNTNTPITKPIINFIGDFFYYYEVPTTVTEDDVTVKFPSDPDESEVDKVAAAAVGSEVVAEPVTSVEPKTIELNVIASTFDELIFKIMSKRSTR